MPNYIGWKGQKLDFGFLSNLIAGNSRNKREREWAKSRFPHGTCHIFMAMLSLSWLLAHFIITLNKKAYPIIVLNFLFLSSLVDFVRYYFCLFWSSGNSAKMSLSCIWGRYLPFLSMDGAIQVYKLFWSTHLWLNFMRNEVNHFIFSFLYYSRL